MELYKGDESYQSLFDYMKSAERILAERGNAATLRKDAVVSAIVRKDGKDSFLDMKRRHYNIRLEEFVAGGANGHLLDIVDDHIVPRSAIIYLTPRNTLGRAPFYSSEKRIGSCYVKTLWFNIGVLLLMCVVAIVLLLTDCPGRYVRGS